MIALGAASCSDWTDMEIHDSHVTSRPEQDPQGYADYTRGLREFKASAHRIAYACLDNAPDRSVSERDFLRSLPDSLDLVAMRNADRLSAADVADMTFVRADYATRVLYRVDAAKGAQAVADAAAAVRSGAFDGMVLASATSVPDDMAALVSGLPGVLLFEGTPSLLPASACDAFDWFIIDASAAKDSYDIETAVRYSVAYAGIPAGKILLGVVPGASITDADGVTRNSLAGAAYAANVTAGGLAGFAVNNVGADYYDADIIYKRLRGGIQLLNPARHN